MTRKPAIRIVVAFLSLCLLGAAGWYVFGPTKKPVPTNDDLSLRVEVEIVHKPIALADAREVPFNLTVRPFLERYCYSCHGSEKPKAELDLSRDTTVAGIAKNMRHWETALERLESQEMPPHDAQRQPTAEERTAVVAWIKDLRDHEAEKDAGDPGTVLARRLSNAEFDYTFAT